MGGALKKVKRVATMFGLTDDSRYDDLYRANGEPTEDIFVADDQEAQAGQISVMPQRIAPVEAVPQIADASRIVSVRPRSYNDARMIGENFRDGVPVIMNLCDMADGAEKRLVDFASGLTFGLRGEIERVSNKVFLLCPHNLTVGAEDKERIASGGFFNQS